MNIALFSDTYLPDINGVATSVNSLFKLLQSKGHNCYVVTTNTGKGVTYEDSIIRIPGLELKKLYGYRASFVFNDEAFDILKTLDLDIIHVNTEFGVGQFGFLVGSRLDLPVVYTYHTMYEDYSYYITKGYFDRFSKWTLREFCRSCMVRATEIISPSTKTEVYIRSIGVEKRINVVPTGFDFSRFNVDLNSPKVLEIKKRFNIKSDEKILLCLGRLAKEKSFDLIVEGFNNYLLETKNIKARLFFVGGGPAENDLKKQVNEFGIDSNVTFVGKVPLEDVPYYYACSDIFLNASISETQGLTFMEAMASNVVILCRYDNNLVNVINDQISGFFFTDLSNFTSKLTYVLSLDEKDLNTIKSNAYKSIDAFSEKNFYNNIMEVYHRAIRRNW